MVRPRGKSNPMNPARRLKTSSSNGPSVLNLQMAPLAAIPPALEEDLESQARASLSLFGFGVPDAVNWNRVNAAESPTATSASLNGSNGAGLNGHANGSSAAASNNVTLLERVCPIGTNAFLWNTMNMGESGVTGMSASLVNDPNAVDGSMNPGEDDPDWDPLGYGHDFQSKLLQQYLVKCIAFVPASVDEVVDLIIRSDRDDMDAAMNHLVGVKMTASGIIYRRRRRRAKTVQRRRSDRSTSGSSVATTTGTSSSRGTATSARDSNRRSTQPLIRSVQTSTTPPRPRGLQSPADLSGSSSSESDDDVDDDDEVVEVLDEDAEQALARALPPTQQRHTGLRPPAMSASSLESHSNSSSSSSLLQHTSHNSSSSSLHAASHSASSSSLPPFSSYLDEYRASLTQSGQQGNLSLKWVVAERTGRMFTQRFNYCLLDYECVLVNDWDDDASAGGGVRPMYVRALQSVYAAPCQPWLDELGPRPSDLQPAGIMVRDAAHRPGFVEVQFVASMLEKTHSPMQARRPKLLALVAKIAKLEEVLTSRRLSQSLLAHQPHWVHNRDRPVCNCCDLAFSLRRRRHHCRLCGEICCSDCCPKKDVALPEIGTRSVRVCVFCVQQKRRHSGDVLDAARTPVLSPVSQSAYAPSQSPPFYAPPLQHSLSSTSSSSSPSLSEYYLSASSYGGSGSLGDRKPSLASSVFQKLKSSSSLG